MTLSDILGKQLRDPDKTLPEVLLNAKLWTHVVMTNQAIKSTSNNNDFCVELNNYVNEFGPKANELYYPLLSSINSQIEKNPSLVKLPIAKLSEQLENTVAVGEIITAASVCMVFDTLREMTGDPDRAFNNLNKCIALATHPNHEGMNN